ncbi:uncharacterized protein VTP21DRAFT_4760 [Calcarisporiella thermophila]|uniref:uncharacterized protein n=1 Tax=Calcarisporiella thermophila TaxID=911321 RepID=UPI0037427F6A
MTLVISVIRQKITPLSTSVSLVKRDSDNLIWLNMVKIIIYLNILVIRLYFPKSKDPFQVSIDRVTFTRCIMHDDMSQFIKVNSQSLQGTVFFSLGIFGLTIIARVHIIWVRVGFEEREIALGNLK